MITPPKRKQISLSVLDINLDNPRFEAATSQREAIIKMVIDQKINSSGSKLYNIAKHIIDNGFNPSDPIYVTPSTDEQKHYTVLEGNRRITALKLLLHPSIIDKEFKTLAAKFQKLANTADMKQFEKIEVLVFDNPEDAKIWIELKHTGQNDGIGTVEWNTEQQQRYKGNSSLIDIIDYAKNADNISNEIKSKLESLKLTNFERLVSDPKVKEFLGLKKKGGKYYNTIEPKEFDKGLEELFTRITHPKFKVTEIYYKGDREKFLKSIPKKNWPIKTIVNEWSVSNPPSEPVKATRRIVDNGRTKHIPKSTDRSTLIPKNCNLNIPEAKPNNIYLELKNLDIDDYPNAVSVLFRVFLELSTDYYIKDKSITIRESDRLKDKIKKVYTNMIDRKSVTEDQVLGAKEIATNDQGLLSVNTFHAYVHNINFSSSPLEMKIKWDNLQFFITKIWE